MTHSISGVNIIVAVGSVDGMAGAAACIRLLKNSNIQVIFTQAFQVNQIDVFNWPLKSKVGLIDLGVNNEGRTPNPKLTEDFVRKIYDCGHSILFIADEHGKEAWENVLQNCGHSTKELSISPKDRGEKYGSSCAILLEALEEFADSHTKALLRDGDQGDRMNFNTHFGEIFNNSVKSNMVDPIRRPYLVNHMALNEFPDEKIQGWMDEYAEMERTLPLILESRQDLGNGISLYDGTLGRHDATSVFKNAYELSSIAALKGTPVFLQGKMQQGASIATSNSRLDVLKVIQDAGISAGGMSAKANFALENLDDALKAISTAAAVL